MSRCHRQRGSALTISIICMMVCITTGMGLMALTLTTLRLSSNMSRKTLAFNLAESGGDRTVRWFKNQATPPGGTSAFDPFGGVQTLGEGTYRVTATPDAGNGGAFLKKYNVVVTGTVRGISQNMEIVIRQQSFGKYAYFTDAEVSSISGGRIWFYSGDRIRGPAHSNNAGNSNFQVNWGGSTAPIFEALVTSVGSSVSYSPSKPTKESDFLKVYKTGSKGYQLGVDPIALPPSSNMQRDAAWGASTGFPATNGVYIPTGGGVYIRGDATVALSVVSGKQVFTIVQSSTTTTVTVDFAAGTTTKKVGSTTTTTYGTNTGVVYSTGNITALSGTIANNTVSGSTITTRNAFTIATDVNNNKSMTITNNLTYASDVDPALPVNHATNLLPGTLGLVSRNVIISSSAPTNLEINAVMLAGSSSTSDGSFYVSNYDSRTPVGTLTVMGGIIQKARGPVGQLSGNTISSGYAKNYYYDPRLADNPPPYYPTTGLFDRVSWRRLPG